MRKNYFLFLLCLCSGFSLCAQLVANNDAPSQFNGQFGGYYNALSNDTYNGSAITECALVTVTAIDSPSPLITVSPCGYVSVQPGLPPGTYVLTYQVCLADSPGTCTSATVLINICSLPTPNVTTVPPDCSTQNGSIQFSNLPAGNWILHFTVNENAPIDIPGSGGTDSVTASIPRTERVPVA